MIDAMGASVSALVQGLLFPLLQPWLGAPVFMFYLLSGVAVVYAVYSFSCYLLKPTQVGWLKLILYGNLLYCLLIAVLTILYSQQISFLGLLVFLSEIVIILVLAFFEKQIAQKVSFT